MKSTYARFSRQCGIVFSLLLLVSCSSLPRVSLFQDNNSGLQLSSGQSANTHFFTNEVNHDTGISLVGGQSYTLEMTLLSNWIDSTIAADENDKPLSEIGFDNSLMPYEVLGLSRRSRAHRWFELMLEQPACSGSSLSGVTELDYDEDAKQYLFTASCTGNLNLFVNDSYGFYGNNVGYANIKLSRLN